MAQNIFNSVKLDRPKNNVFDLSHDVKMSLNMGELVPTVALECIPGDKFNLGCESLLRFAPMVAPVMHRINVTMHYFFVPNRILWPNWENFITQTQVAGVIPAAPYFDIGTSEANNLRLLDYMGIPDARNAGQNVPMRISPFVFAAYQKVFNEYYRDQNLVPSVIDTLVDGDNVANQGALLTLRRRAWEHDYFTASLPFAQKGPAVDIPLGEVQLNPDWHDDGSTPHFPDKDGNIDPGANQIFQAELLADNKPGIWGDPDDLPPGADKRRAFDPDGSLTVGATTINDLRRSFRLQEWLEKQARGGTRYIESILAHFGIRSSDKRLQRPEYITGIKSPVRISEVLNTAGADDRPQGDMAGHGIATVASKYGSYKCEEHGFIIGIASVTPTTAYQDGIPKHFLKTEDAFDYAWPEFAHLGEQEVRLKELYAWTTNADDVFGYVPRYSEYKYMANRVAGDFRTSLDFWHLGRKFANEPQLNQEFIECNPTHRIFAVDDPDTQKLWAHVYHRIRAVRPLPKYGTPTF